MSFEYGKAFEAIEKNKSIDDVSEFMAAVIDVCEMLAPDGDWEAFRGLPYQEESDLLSSHVEKVLNSEPAPFEPKGFWFGINNPVLDTGDTSSGIYFSVSSKYDPDDVDADWACEAEFYPERGAFKSRVMASLYRLAYAESGLGNKAEYPLCLAYGLKLAQKAMDNYKAKYPGSAIGYAVGFDSGDFLNQGWL